MARILKNMMETIVEQQIEELLPRLGGCQCEDCRMDMKALVLNKLPSKYVATTTGEIMSRLDSYARQNKADLTAAIIEAAKIVAEHPRHEDK